MFLAIDLLGFAAEIFTPHFDYAQCIALALPLERRGDKKPTLYKGGWGVKISAVPIAIHVLMIINDRNPRSICRVGSAHRQGFG